MKNKRCQHCGDFLDKIVFSREMSEEWAWNGDNWECTYRTSLVDNPHLEVRCSNCDNIVGIGKDFNF
jgi:phage FluMu protein Com